MIPIFEEDDGWYYTDDEGVDHGPFRDEQSAISAYGRYRASQGNCPTCKGD